MCRHRRASGKGWSCALPPTLNVRRVLVSEMPRRESAYAISELEPQEAPGAVWLHGTSKWKALQLRECPMLKHDTGARMTKA